MADEPAGRSATITIPGTKTKVKKTWLLLAGIGVLVLFLMFRRGPGVLPPEELSEEEDVARADLDAERDALDQAIHGEIEDLGARLEAVESGQFSAALPDLGPLPETTASTTIEPLPSFGLPAEMGVPFAPVFEPLPGTASIQPPTPRLAGSLPASAKAQPGAPSAKPLAGAVITPKATAPARAFAPVAGALLGAALAVAGPAPKPTKQAAPARAPAPKSIKQAAPAPVFARVAAPAPAPVKPKAALPPPPPPPKPKAAPVDPERLFTDWLRAMGLKPKSSAEREKLRAKWQSSRR